MDQNPTVVAGESADELLEVLLEMREQSAFEPDADGMCRIDVTLPTARLVPLWRAVMRVEAELLLQDAATLTSFDGLRTPDQRRCDAFLALALRVSDALSQNATGT